MSQIISFRDLSIRLIPFLILLICVACNGEGGVSGVSDQKVRTLMEAQKICNHLNRSLEYSGEGGRSEARVEGKIITSKEKISFIKILIPDLDNLSHFSKVEKALGEYKTKNSMLSVTIIAYVPTGGKGGEQSFRQVRRVFEPKAIGEKGAFCLVPIKN